MASARSVAVACAAIGAATLSQAHAAPSDKAACLDSYQQGQVLSRRGELLAARDHLGVCARAPCPALLAPECVAWLADVDRRMPSLVVAARTPEGGDVQAARIVIDGRRVAENVDGRAVEVNPGEHEIRVEPTAREGGPPVVVRLVAAEAEKQRLVVVTLAPTLPLAPPAPPATEAPPTAPARRVPTGSWIAGGVAGAATLSFAVFSLLGNGTYADLERCRGTCAEDDVRTTRTLYTVGDLSLAGAIVSLGLAVALYLTSR